MILQNIQARMRVQITFPEPEAKRKGQVIGSAGGEQMVATGEIKCFPTYKLCILHGRAHVF